MFFLVGLLSIIHISFYLTLLKKWLRIECIDNEKRRQSFSVIIPVRNEVSSIEDLLRDLENQKYPKDQFEVILVDDFSTDGTVEKVRQLISSMAIKVQIILLDDKAKAGKKAALTLGVGHAIYDTIITTDADCRVGNEWILSFSKAFTDEINIVAGPVALIGDGIFASMQKVEFTGLMTLGAVTLEDNNPSMCSGANLAFRKKAFEGVGGYTSNIHIPSGDDEFLLYDILNKYPRSGRFLKNQQAIVRTKAHDAFKSFFNQRARWVSKWKYNRNWKLRLLAVLFFFDYAALVLLIFLAGQNMLGLIFGTSIVFLRLLSNYLFLRPAAKFLGQRNDTLAFFLLQIFYPFHVLLMGVLSIFGRYTWKGRKY